MNDWKRNTNTNTGDDVLHTTDHDGQAVKWAGEDHYNVFIKGQYVGKVATVGDLP